MGFSDPEHMPQLGWRDMPPEDRDEAEMDEREAQADARDAARGPAPYEPWRYRDADADA